MKINLILFLSTFFFLSSCKGPEGPQGPTGPSGSDALTDPSVKPKVIWTFPSNGQVGPISNLGDEIYIRFNKILDISTVNRSVQITPSASGYAYIDTNGIWSPAGDWVVVDIDADSSLWNISQTYTFTILTTLKDINGNSLSAPYSFSFTPEPYFRVSYSYPNNGATNVSRSSYIELGFNNRINFSTFQSSISISPPVSGSWNYSGYDYVYLSPSSQLNPNTVYVVTLGTGMRDAQGRALSSPYTFSFTTGQ